MKAVAVGLPVLDLGQPLLPVAGQLGRRERVACPAARSWRPLVVAASALPSALDVADAQQPLDRVGAGGGRAQAGLLHRLAQLLVLDLLAGRLHGAQQRCLGVAAGRLGLLLEHLGLLRSVPRSPSSIRGSDCAARRRRPAAAPRRRPRRRRRRRASRPRAAAGRWCGSGARRQPRSRPRCPRTGPRGGTRPGSGGRPGRRRGGRRRTAPRVGSSPVGMIAWWSSTLASLTTRASGQHVQAGHVLGVRAVLRGGRSGCGRSASGRRSGRPAGTGSACADR